MSGRDCLASTRHFSKRAFLMGVIGEASFLQEREPTQFSEALLGQTENANLVLHAGCRGIPERQGDGQAPAADAGPESKP